MIDPITTVTSTRDKLFDKMASKAEGWSVKSGAFSKDVPLNEIDFFATRVLCRAIEKNERIALAVPKIIPGTALGLAAYLTVNRFIESRTKGYEKLSLIFEGYQFTGIEGETPLVVVTKRRNLRDYFLLSELRFNGQAFPFSATFPLLRINRLGKCVPLVAGAEERQIKASPIVFYHFDQLQDFPEDLKGAVILVELDEPITYATSQRLVDFMSQVEPRAVLAITNTFDKNQSQRLGAQGFKQITLSPELVTRYKSSTSDMPSLASSLYGVPAEVSISLSSVDDSELDRYIARIARTLINISDSLGGKLPASYYSARALFSILKNLAVPMDLYEQARKEYPNSKSLKHNLKGLFANQYLDLDDAQEAIIRPLWPSLGDDFLSLYNILSTRNKKYEDLLERATKMDGGAVVFYDSIQANIFKSVLKNLGGDSTIVVSSLKEAAYLEDKPESVLLTGIWRKFDEKALFSLLPPKLEVISYRSELRSAESTLKHLNDFREVDTRECLKSLGWELAPGEGEPVPWLSLDDLSRQQIKESKEVQTNDSEDYPSFDELLGEISDEDYLDADEFEEIETEGYVITLDNGESGYLLPDREVLVYADKNSAIGPVTPQFLQSGDYLLTVEAENNGEVFAGLVERTRSLCGADARVVGEWEEAMRKIRAMFGPGEEALFVSALEMVRCQRSEATIRQWLRGTTLAPQDAGDIQKLLQVAALPNSLDVAQSISDEVEKVRAFHRRLGKKLHQKMADLLADSTRSAKPSLIDAEIDEILDLTHTVCIEDISSLGPIPKGTKRLYALS